MVRIFMILGCAAVLAGGPAVSSPAPANQQPGRAASSVARDVIRPVLGESREAAESRPDRMQRRRWHQRWDNRFDSWDGWSRGLPHGGAVLLSRVEVPRSS